MLYNCITMYGVKKHKNQKFRQFVWRIYLEGGISENRGDTRSVRETVHENMISREMCQDDVFFFVV
jgi:hypothetical protein